MGSVLLNSMSIHNNSCNTHICSTGNPHSWCEWGELFEGSPQRSTGGHTPLLELLVLHWHFSSTANKR